MKNANLKISLIILTIMLTALKLYCQNNIHDIKITQLENILEKKNPSLADETLTEFGFILTERDYWDQKPLPFDNYTFAYNYDKQTERASIWLTLNLRDIAGSRKQIKSDSLWIENTLAFVSERNSIEIIGYDDEFYSNLTNCIRNSYQKVKSEFFERINAFQYYYSNGNFEYIFYKNTEKYRIIIKCHNESEELYLDSLLNEMTK